jgi:hypothetical protein
MIKPKIYMSLIQSFRLLSRIFDTSENKMLAHLEEGDVAETVGKKSSDLPTCSEKKLFLLSVVDPGCLLFIPDLGY